jgi:hypothetical protein
MMTDRPPPSMLVTSPAMIGGHGCVADEAGARAINAAL